MDKDKLVRHTSILMLTLTLANVFGLTFHVVIGRMLGPAEYGSLAVLFSILSIMNFGNKTIEAMMSRLASREKPGRVKGALILVLAVLAITSTSFLLLLSVFGTSIIRFFHLPSVSILINFGVFICLSLTIPAFIGVLNGLQRFWWIGIPEALSHFLRLAFSFGLVSLGLGLTGAIISLNIATVIWIGILAFALISVFKTKARPANLVLGAVHSLPVLVIFGLTMLLLNIDLLVIKHLFPGTPAGNYAAAAIIAKVIWYGSAEFVGSAVFPKASRKPSASLLLRALMLTSIPAIIGAAAMGFFPASIGSLLFGEGYDLVLLPVLAASMAFFSLTYIMVMYAIATKDHGIWLFLAAGIALWSGGIIVFHETMAEIALVTLVTHIMVFSILAMRNSFIVFISHKHR